MFPQAARIPGAPKGSAGPDAETRWPLDKAETAADMAQGMMRSRRPLQPVPEKAGAS